MKGLNRRRLAVLELLIATAFWGFGFVATIWAMPTVDAFELTLLRFAFAGVVGLPAVVAVARSGGTQKMARMSLLPAMFLTSTLIFQTWGLEYTAPTKSAFITTLYVVFVPLLEVILAGRAISAALWACVALALAGTALMVRLGFSAVNYGDVLTFICALTATGQIYWMGKVSPRVERPFAFNIFQCLWSIPMTLPFVHLGGLGARLVHFAEWPPKALAGIASLAIGSTVIAFYLQVRAQTKLSPTVSSLLFLLESPFALLFSLLLTSKSLSATESAGALLIFVAALWATRLEARSIKD
jgi:drug/metabolite transporter (DMT)-like permease